MKLRETYKGLRVNLRTKLQQNQLTIGPWINDSTLLLINIEINS